MNNPEKTFLALTNVYVEALPDPEIKWDAPFLAVNKSVVTTCARLRIKMNVMHDAATHSDGILMDIRAYVS